MPRLRSRPFARPDELRTFAHGHAEALTLDESLVGRATYEPGWRWTLDMPDITGTSTCQVHDLGYSISGVMHVATDDRQHVDIDPGTKDLLEGSGLMLEDAGVVALKGIAGERHVFRVAAVATTTQEKIT